MDFLTQLKIYAYSHLETNKNWKRMKTNYLNGVDIYKLMTSEVISTRDNVSKFVELKI